MRLIWLWGIWGFLLMLTHCTSAPKTVKSKSKTATLLYFADLHGHFKEHPELFWNPSASHKAQIQIAGGLDRIAHVVSEIRRHNPRGVLFMDAGDTIQGAAEVALTQGQVAVELLNNMNIDLAIPGNWEVVYGTKQFKKISEELNYPFIASNIRDEKTKELVFEPYVIKDLNGIKVALIGFTDPDVPIRQPPSFSKGFTYQNHEVLQPLINKIKKNSEAEVVVLLTHIGLPKAVDLAGKLSGVDVVLSSDTHERTYEPIIRGKTWVVEPGAFGSFLGQLDLTIDHKGRLHKQWKLLELKQDLYAKDKKMESVILKKLKPFKNQLSKKVGLTEVPLVRYNVLETTMDAVLADALRAATGTDIALSNGFRFAYPIPPGPIIESDLWSVFPINTEIKTGLLSGKQIKVFFEKEIENVFSEDAAKLFGGWLPRTSGLSLEFDISRPAFNRITKILINNKPIEEDKKYSVTTCVREGDPDTTLCRIPNATDIKIKNFDAHEAVRRYLQKTGPLKMPELGRIKALGLPPNVRSQFYRN